jgi:mono/diheme cytochrome c family protein
MARWLLLAAAVLLLVLAMAGCASRQSSGFHLPDGDPAAGQQAFVTLQCHTCHRVSGVDLPEPSATPAVRLGGDVIALPTYGELTSDIIAPSADFATGYPADRIMVAGHSRMPDYTQKMSVRQMADLVAFLHARYSLRPVPYPVR